MTYPVLYSFRRCPYAMRARLALSVSGVKVEIREILLKQKPSQMLRASAKGTVPVLVLPDNTVIDESLDIMLWALGKHDPEQWLPTDPETRGIAETLVSCHDFQFKPCLDRYKYAVRFPEKSETDYRQEALFFFNKLEALLAKTEYLLGDSVSYADMAIFPFIRQFAGVDRGWFEQSPYPRVRQWLHEHVHSALFVDIMRKLPQWHERDEPVFFPENRDLLTRNNL